MTKICPLFAEVLLLVIVIAICSCQEAGPNVDDSTPQITFEIAGKIREEYGGRLLNLAGVHSKAKFWPQRPKRSAAGLKNYFDGTITIRTPTLVHTIGVNASLILTPEPDLSPEESQTDSNRLKREQVGRPVTFRFFIQIALGDGPNKVVIGLRARLSATQLSEDLIRREYDDAEDFVRDYSLNFAGTITDVSRHSAESVGVLFNLGVKPVENEPRSKRSDEPNKPELKFEGNLTYISSRPYGTYTVVVGLEGDVNIEDMSERDTDSPAKEFESSIGDDLLIVGEGHLTSGTNVTIPLNSEIFASAKPESKNSGDRKARESDVENSNPKPLHQLEFNGRIGARTGVDRNRNRKSKPDYIGVMANIQWHDLGLREI